MKEVRFVWDSTRKHPLNLIFPPVIDQIFVGSKIREKGKWQVEDAGLGGRVRWEQIGTSQQAFCMALEIPAGGFAYWRRRYRKV